MDNIAQPPARTVEEWAKHYIESRDWKVKLSPPSAPKLWASCPQALDLRPGRPSDLRLTTTKPRTFKAGSLKSIEARAALQHKFWHHELQAAELMCWALLRFCHTPLAFRKGLLRIFKDEVRHMALYQGEIEALGFTLSDFEVRDWFWERVPTCETEVEFVALLGMGLEAANLEHTLRFADWFRNVGDQRGAAIQEQVGLEEISHVRFAVRWFRTWTGDVQFKEWCEQLPPPLTPLLMRGKSLDMNRRRNAEFPEEFLEELKQWRAEPTSNRVRKTKPSGPCTRTQNDLQNENNS